jgi:hypothetical protein
MGLGFKSAVRRRLVMGVVTGAMALLLLAANAPAGILWASDSGSGSHIYRLNSDTGAQISSFIGPGPYADAVVLDNSGTFLHIADSSPGATSRIWRTTLTGTVISSILVPYDLEGMTQLANGNLVISDVNTNPGSIVTINPVSGAVISSFTPVAQEAGLDTDGTSLIYGVRTNGLIDTYTLTGTVVGSPINSGLTGTVLGLAYTGSSFFVSSTTGIREVTPGGALIRSYAAPGTFTEGLDYVVPEPTSLAATAALALAALARRRSRN